MRSFGQIVAVLVVLVVVSTSVPGMLSEGRSSPSSVDDSTGPAVETAQQTTPSPDIEVHPESIRFSSGEYGAATRDLTVRNVGTATLTVRAMDVVGPDQGAFGLTFPGQITLDPGEERTVDVSFEASDTRPRFAMVHVLSDDPDEPQRNVWLTNTRTVADVSPSRVLERKTLVNATVRNAEANTTQSINVSWPLTRDDVVAVDAISFTPRRDGDVVLSVATNTSRFGTVPTFDLEDGTEPAGYVHVEHSIPNEDVRNVTFTVRLRKDRLRGNETGVEDVALYRYEDDSWVELPTRFEHADVTHYFFEARAPGLSDFATGIKQAKFQITDAVVTVTRITTADGTTVLVQVRNVGRADGTYSVKLLLQDEVVDRQALSIAPNGTRQATFEQTFADPGVYEVYVNDRFVGNVTVVSPTTQTAGDRTASPRSDGSAIDRPLPGFDVATALVALLVAVLGLAGRRRH